MAAPVPQNHYISVFGRTTGMNGENFDPIEFEGNGIAVLTPSKCTITETLNGGYSLTLTHPTDSDNVWKTLYPLNFIKAQGQIFRIQSAETSYDGSSSGNVTIYAEHVTYMMNDAWIFHGSLVCGEWMGELIDKSNAESRPNGDTSWGGAEKRFPNFRYTIGSEMSIPSAYKTETIEGYLNKQYVHDIGEGKTRYQVMMEFIQKFGGELYRDNFYFSIYNRMEHSLGGEGKIDAFDIRLGENMLGIKRKVDISNFCSYFQGYSEDSGIATISYGDMSGFMNNIVREKHYSNITDFGILEHETASYFNYHMNPEFTYTLKLKDLRQNPNFRMLSGVRFKVGDIGRIVDERLGLSNNLRLEITQTKANGITGEVEEITLKSISAFEWNYGSVKLPEFPDIPEPQIDKTKIAVIRLDENMQETSEITYYGWLGSAIAYMSANTDKNYSVVIGSQISEYTVPGKVVTGFSWMENLIKITIPAEKITSISAQAFGYCKNLRQVTFTKGQNMILKNIWADAFEHCESLRSIDIPDSVEEFKTRVMPDHGSTATSAAFYCCYNLETVHLSENLKSVPRHAFQNCRALKNINIPDSVTSIGDYAFEDCEALKYVKIGENVSTISQYAFNSCSALENVDFNENLQGLGFYAFANCTSLKNVTLPDSIVNFSQSPFGSQFYGCTSLKKIKLPANMPVIPYCMFYGCENLTSVVMPENPSKIEDKAFSGCASLPEMPIPSSVNEIGKSAFEGCSSIAVMTVPENVGTIGSSAFSGCTSLRLIEVANAKYGLASDPWGAPNFISTESADRIIERGEPLPKDKQIVTWSGSGGISDLDEKVLLKELNADGTVKKYNTVKSTGYLKGFLQENPDKLYAVDIGALCIGKEGSPTYATITAESFSGLTNLKNLSIPSTFTTIEENAFSGCTELDYLEIVKPKGAISGEPWGAPAGTVIYYAAELITENGDTLTARDFLTVRTTGNNSEFNTGLSGILRPDAVPEEPVEKTLYILNENNTFSLKLGTKELSL